jgi:hypothetical protein
MSEKALSSEEVAILIRARQILKDKHIEADADVSAICKAAGISRKTGYQWADKHLSGSADRQKELQDKLAGLKADYDQLKKEYDDVSFENRGRKLAWEIHHVDEWLAAKKNTTASRKDKKR